MKKLFSIIMVLAVFTITGCGGGGGGGDNSNSGGSKTSTPIVQFFEAQPDAVVTSGFEQEFPDYQTAVLAWEVKNAEGHRIEIAWTEGKHSFCATVEPYTIDYLSLDCPDPMITEKNWVNIQEVPPAGTMDVRPAQNTTYYLLIDGEVAELVYEDEWWVGISSTNTVSATVNVYVYNPDDLVITLMHWENPNNTHIARWKDGTIRVYNPTTCPDKNIQDALDFWNSKLPDNINLVMTDDPNNYDIEILDVSYLPNPAGAAWAGCNVNQVAGTYEYVDCGIAIYDMDAVCNQNSQFYTYSNSISTFAHEFGHALGMTAHPGTSDDNYTYIEEQYDLYRRPSLMSAKALTYTPEDAWTPLQDIFFRHLYNLPVGICLDNSRCP